MQAPPSRHKDKHKDNRSTTCRCRNRENKQLMHCCGLNTDCSLYAVRQPRRYPPQERKQAARQSKTTQTDSKACSKSHRDIVGLRSEFGKPILTSASAGYEYLLFKATILESSFATSLPHSLPARKMNRTARTLPSVAQTCWREVGVEEQPEELARGRVRLKFGTCHTKRAIRLRGRGGRHDTQKGP